MPAPTAPVPGYYADPLDAARERWWDGTAWTETVRSPDTGAPEAVNPETVQPETVRPETVRPETVQPETGRSEVVQPEAQIPAQPQPARPTVPAGLYPDPYGQAPLRWWDGRQWTPQTSDPRAAHLLGHPGRPPAVAPAASPAGGAGASAFTARLADALTPLRTDRRLLAGALVLVLAVGAGGWFLLARGGPDAPPPPPPASIAAAITLRAGDLPAGWTVEPPDADADDPAGQALERDLARCLDGPGHATSLLHTADSPTWSRGTGEVSGSIDIVRSAAQAQQDLAAARASAAPSCLGRVATPALRKAFAGQGGTLTGFSVTRLPNVPADGFGLRLKATVVVDRKTVVLWGDEYGFVRGTAEVSLEQDSVGVAPDRTVAQHALARLRARAAAELPSGS